MTSKSPVANTVLSSRAIIRGHITAWHWRKLVELQRPESCSDYHCFSFSNLFQSPAHIDRQCLTKVARSLIMVAPDGDVTLTINAEGACLALETRAGCVEVWIWILSNL